MKGQYNLGSNPKYYPYVVYTFTPNQIFNVDGVWGKKKLLKTLPNLKQSSIVQALNIENNLLFDFEIYLNPETRRSTRTAYSLSNMLSNLGGTISLLKTLFNTIMILISKHLFYVEMVNQLFKQQRRRDLRKSPITAGWSFKLFLAN